MLGPDAVERREHAAEDVVARPHRAGALERPEVGDVLDHDDDRRIAPGVAADRAGLGRVDVAAGRGRRRCARSRPGAPRTAAPSSCSRFLMRCSAARRAERGPSPGRRARSWIRRSISGPATEWANSPLPLAGEVESARKRRPGEGSAGDSSLTPTLSRKRERGQGSVSSLRTASAQAGAAGPW